jgi:hypothetical protein
MRYYIYLQYCRVYKKPLENTEGTIKHGQPKETGNIDEEKQNTKTMCMLRIKNTKTLWFLSGFPR